MLIHGKLGTRELALAVTFTALYVVFGVVKFSPIIGLPGQAITAAAIFAPIIGTLFGPYIGVLSAGLGGIIGISVGYFSLLSFAAGVVAALLSGAVSRGRRMVSVIVYLLIFLLLAFYPVIGPAWLYPPYLWFQIVGFIILISPLQSIAIKELKSNSDSRLLYAFFVTSLTSTLAGQIAGSVTYEVIIYPDIKGATGTWLATALLYPMERVIIAIGSAMIGTTLFKILKNTNFVSFFNNVNREENCS
ncbi:MAG: hypothetical protein QXN36_04335 [Candidatus Bathyarchaeia archaeon]